MPPAYKKSSANAPRRRRALSSSGSLASAVLGVQYNGSARSGHTCHECVIQIPTCVCVCVCNENSRDDDEHDALCSDATSLISYKIYTQTHIFSSRPCLLACARALFRATAPHFVLGHTQTHAHTHSGKRWEGGGGLSYANN